MFCVAVFCLFAILAKIKQDGTTASDTLFAPWKYIILYQLMLNKKAGNTTVSVAFGYRFLEKDGENIDEKKRI